jgi:hypothetical protein
VIPDDKGIRITLPLFIRRNHHPPWTTTFILQETEKLAQMGQAGFAVVERQFEALAGGMHKRFDALDQRLDRIEKSHGYRLETLERDVADLKTGIGKEQRKISLGR